MNLIEIMEKRMKLEEELKEFIKNFEISRDGLQNSIQEAKEIEELMFNNVEFKLIVLAEQILEIEGKIWERADHESETIQDVAIKMFIKRSSYLLGGFLGNKRYDGFYQRCDCSYGYGPKHGHIVDRIGLTKYGLHNYDNLTDEQRTACVYYLKNYKRIIDIKNNMK